MLEKIIDWSITNKFMVVMLTLFVTIGGLYALKQTPLDAIPDLSDVQVIGSRGTGPGQFLKPRALALDRDDNLYVADMTGRVRASTVNGSVELIARVTEASGQ